MKNAILIGAVLAPLFFAPLWAHSQGVLYVSNLGQSPTGSTAIGSNSWIAQTISTGTNSGGYALNSIQLLMDAASGIPNGFSVSVYGASNGVPYNDLGALSGADPSAGGLFSYVASGLTLSPNTGYFIVLTAATAVTQGSYSWSGGFGPIPGIGGWDIFGDYYGSANGSTWQISRQYTFQMAINATPLPEPSSLWLAGLGLTAVSLWRRRQP